MLKKYLYLFYLIILPFLSCKEIYTPNVNSSEKVLVVNGHIDSKLENYTIQLYYAAPFNETSYTPLSGAIVEVADQTNTKYFFYESSKGNYISNSSLFVPQIGNTYTLTITTPDKKIYRSSSQTLYENGEIRTIYPYFSSKNFETNVGDKIVFRNFQGIELLAEINSNILTNLNYYRFETKVLAQYTSKAENNDTISYCWDKYTVNQDFNTNNTDHESTASYFHSLGFCPVDTAFYDIKKGMILLPTNPPKQIAIYRKLHSYMLTITQYHLNKDVHEFYAAVNKQISDKQKLFDRINSQCVGNIKCISNPNERVFGVFDVSSSSSNSYLITMGDFYSYVSLLPIEYLNMSTISSSDCWNEQAPPFWTQSETFK